MVHFVVFDAVVDHLFLTSEAVNLSFHGKICAVHSVGRSRNTLNPLHCYKCNIVKNTTSATPYRGFLASMKRKVTLLYITQFL